MRVQGRGYVFTVILSLAAPEFSALPVAAQTVAEETPYQISASPDVDETLFLMRAIEQIYATWPRADSAALTDWLTYTRTRTLALRAGIVAGVLDRRLLGLYDDCLGLLDAYETYLVNLNAIRRRSENQAVLDGLGSLYAGIKQKAESQDSARRAGASKEEIENTGDVPGVIAGLADAATRYQQRTASEQAATDAEQRRLDATFRKTWSTAVAVAAALSNSHGWRPGEAGFDDTRKAAMR